MTAPDHFEVAPYPIGRFVDGHFVGERRVECASADIENLLAWLDLYPNNHWPYPFGGWSQTAVLTAATVKPKQDSQVTSNSKPLINYERAWIDLTYTTKGMMYLGGRYLWEELHAGQKNVPIPRPPGLLWADGTPLLVGEQQLAKHAAATTYSISCFKLAVTPAAILILQDGAVNATAYITATLGVIFPAESMLCVGAKLERGSPGSATSSWKQAHYTFYINPNGWNNYWRPETGLWEAVYLPTGVRYTPQTPVTFAYTGLW